MRANDIKHLAVETIYLVPDSSEGQRCYLWCDDPAPGLGMDPSEAVEYLRKDVHDAIIAKQAKSAKQGMDAAQAVASSNLEQAKRLHADSSPEALESERAANATLTERIAELESLEVTPAMIEAGAQRLVNWACDGLTWPDSWSALDVTAARNDAERVIRSALAVMRGESCS